MMTTVKVSPKFQIVIPKEIREPMGLRAGRRLQMVRFGDHIELIPIEPMSKYRGMFKGMPTEVIRDEEDRV
jgi:AbrB family looped-hinge helix DNA binding protein